MLDSLNEKPFAVCEVGRNPVDDAVADEIHERVRDGDRPEVAVPQDVVEEDLTITERALAVGAVARRVVVPVLLDRRQPFRLRRIAEQEKGDNRHNGRDEGVEVELCAPVAEEHHAPQGECRHQRPADVVRHVPCRDDETALVGAEPVHHGLAGRRPAHPLHPAVDGLQHEHDGQRRVDPLRKSRHRHHGARQQQAERQEVLRVAAIGDRSHQELGDPIGHRQRGQREAEFGLRMLRVFGEDVGKSQRQVVANQVVRGVPAKMPANTLRRCRR